MTAIYLGSHKIINTIPKYMSGLYVLDNACVASISKHHKDVRSYIDKNFNQFIDMRPMTEEELKIKDK